MSADPGWFIADPRPIEARAPYTYFIAQSAEVAAVGVGEQVQLLFELDPPGKTYAAEKMWVTVTRADGDELAGVLDSTPHEAPIAKGDAVAFRRLDILSVVWSDPARDPKPPRRREYWDRCMVDACVLEGERPVEYVYRETPEPLAEGERYPDSGWRIRGQMEGDTDDQLIAREVEYVALGAVLNRDDSWLPLIDAPIGSAFMRDFDTDTYDPVPLD